MFTVRSTLPGINGVSTQDIENLVADLELSTVREELIHSAFLADFIFEDVDELLITLHAVDGGVETSDTNEDLGRGSTIINGRGVTVESVSGDGLIPTGNIEGRKARFVSLAISLMRDVPTPLSSSSTLEGFLNSVHRNVGHIWT